MSFHLKEAHRECGWLVVPARIVRRMRSRTDGGNRKRAGKKRKKKRKREERRILLPRPVPSAQRRSRSVDEPNDGHTLVRLGWHTPSVWGGLVKVVTRWWGPSLAAGRQSRSVGGLSLAESSRARETGAPLYYTQLLLAVASLFLTMDR